jgi:UTP-glucose-1-phosphate uridylyltransferase
LYDAGTLLGWLKTTVALGLKDPSIGPEFRAYLRDRLRD